MLGLAFELINVTAVTISEMIKHARRMEPEDVDRLGAMSEEDRAAEIIPAVVVAARARIEKRHKFGAGLLNSFVTKAREGAMR